MPAYHYRLEYGAVGSFIDSLFSIRDFMRCLALPADMQVARLASRALSAPGPQLETTLKLLSRVVATGSPQVHPLYGARATANHQCSNRVNRSFESNFRAGDTGTLSVNAFRGDTSSASATIARYLILGRELQSFSRGCRDP